MKKTVSLITAAALMLCLLAGCAAKPLAPSYFEAYYNAANAYRALISDREARELCGEEAVGTVVSIERIEREYVPILVSVTGRSQYYADVPLEQWEADYRVVTVEIDEVLEGTFFAPASKWQTGKKAVSFTLPIEYRELEYWDETAPRYTGRRILTGTPEEPDIHVGDSVTLLTNIRGEWSVAAGIYDAFVYLGETRLNIGWLRGEADSRYVFVSEPELHWRRNVIAPRREGVSVLEAAYIEPMRELQKLSTKQAEARSAFVVRGTILETRHVDSPPLYVRDVTNRQFNEPLETWDMDYYRLTIEIDEVFKQEGDPLKPANRIEVLVPLKLTNAESGREIKLDGVVPFERTEVTVYWNEGYENSAADFIVRTEDGDIDVISGTVSREPVPVVWTPID